MNRNKLALYFRELTALAMLATLLVEWMPPKLTAASAFQKPEESLDSPPATPEVPAAPENLADPERLYQYSPLIPPPTPPPPSPSILVLAAALEPVAVSPGEVATLTLHLTTPMEEKIRLAALLPPELRPESKSGPWNFGGGGERAFIQLNPTPGLPVTLTLPLRVEGPLDTSSLIKIEAHQKGDPITTTARIWRVQPGLARITEAGGLLLLPDRQAWLSFEEGPALNDPVTGRTLSEPPTFLPYSLDRIYEIRGPAFDSARLTARLSASTISGPWAEITELAALFRYDPVTDHWHRLPTRRTPDGETLELTAAIDGPGIFAVAISTASDIGNYEQPWTPTIAEAQVDLFTGAASWSYPIQVPAGRTGQVPPLTLSYHSGQIDEMRGEQNPQASWAGLGWNMDIGYITRRIELDENAVPRNTQDYYIVLNGTSSKLIPIGGEQYRTENERFWRIEHKRTSTNRGGDYWNVTTPDGVQYRFGYQDELAGGDSRESAWWMVASRCDGTEALCVTNWRWNLDQVTDLNGNAIRYDYRVERNNFRFWWGLDRYYYSDYSPCPGGTWDCINLIFHEHWVVNQGYIRGGSLEQITYSWPRAAHKIRFEVEGRPDYPTLFDSQANGIQPVQTFWSKERLRAIETLSNGQGQQVRRYELHRDPADNRLLQSIQLIAADGSRMPDVSFGYRTMPGYREGGRDGGDKPWLVQINNGYGGSVTLNYRAPEGLPWFQDGQITAPEEDGKNWYRYRVRELTSNPGIGPLIRRVYEYRSLENDGPHSGTWVDGEFRGHPRVRIREREVNGNLGAYSDTWLYQGINTPAQILCGESRSDGKGLTGLEYRRVQYDAAGTQLAQQTQRWTYRDFGSGRYTVERSAVCEYFNSENGPYRRTDYAYDEYGNVTREYRQGDVTRSGDEATTEIRYIYNPGAWILNRVLETRLIAADGTVAMQTRQAYDDQPLGVPPTRGLATRVFQGLDSWGWVTTTTRYDGWGNPEIAEDALGRTASTRYDDTYHQYSIMTTNPLGQSGRWGWNQRLNVAIEITDANGAVQSLKHDSFGRLTEVIPPGQTVPSTQYRYPTGSAVRAPFAVQTAIRVDPYAAVPEYRRSWTIYDGLGRTIQTQQEAENGSLVVQSTAYNAQNQVVVSTIPYTVAAAGGEYLPPAWSSLPQTQVRYDALGRKITTIEPGNRVTQYAYRNWSRLELDPNGHQKRYDQDGLGRQIAVYEYPEQYNAPNWNAEASAITRYWYNTQNQLIAVRDALGHVTRIEYDPLGRKTSIDDPSMGHWEYRYDPVGNLIEQIDAEGRVLRLTYDSLNRLIMKATGDGVPLVVNEYDRGPYGIGRKTAMSDATGNTRWQYDAEGRLLMESKTIYGEGPFISQWTYNAAGQVTTYTYPTGEMVSWNYNRRGLPQQLRSLTYGTEYVRSVTYEARGEPTSQTWGNGLVSTYTYGPNLRLQQMQLSGGLLDFRYTYDPVGNLTAIMDGANGGQIQRFGYDAADRLLWASTDRNGEGAYQERYTYDLLGNIISQSSGETEDSVLRYTYGQSADPLPSPEPNQPPYRLFFPIIQRRSGETTPGMATLDQPFAVTGTSAGFRAIYDRTGNMVQRTVNEGGRAITYTLAYNAENQLIAITNTATLSVTRYFYDGEGKRVMEIRENQAGSSTKILRLGDVEIEILASGRIVRTHYGIDGQQVAIREQWEYVNNLTYLYVDHLDSVILAAGVNGRPIHRTRYRPFGALRHLAGSQPTEYRFTGQRDAGMGLYDYNARFYDPALGRFIQSDTIVPDLQNPQNLNRYTYVRNNPVNLTDPSGHCPTASKECANLINKIRDDYGINIKDFTKSVWDILTLTNLINALEQYRTFLGPAVYELFKNVTFEIDDEYFAQSGEKDALGAWEYGGRIRLHSKLFLGFYPNRIPLGELFRFVVIHELTHEVIQDLGGDKLYTRFQKAVGWHQKIVRNEQGEEETVWVRSEDQNGPTPYSREGDPKEDLTDTVTAMIVGHTQLSPWDVSNGRSRWVNTWIVNGAATMYANTGGGQ